MKAGLGYKWDTHCLQHDDQYTVYYMMYACRGEEGRNCEILRETLSRPHRSLYHHTCI